jgi:DNA-binding HxlR family transcriptional regulator
VQRRSFADAGCPIARTLDVVGEWWSILILRDAFRGVRRFDDFQQSLGIARNVLAERLARLVEAGVLERTRYQERPPRHDYRLTDAGRELAVPVIALMHWGDRHRAEPAGPPRLTRHRDCGGEIHTRFVCEACGTPVPAAEVDVLPGPGARAHAPR